MNYSEETEENEQLTALKYNTATIIQIQTPTYIYVKEEEKKEARTLNENKLSLLSLSAIRVELFFWNSLL